MSRLILSLSFLLISPVVEAQLLSQLKGYSINGLQRGDQYQLPGRGVDDCSQWADKGFNAYSDNFEFNYGTDTICLRADKELPWYPAPVHRNHAKRCTAEGYALTKAYLTGGGYGEAACIRLEGITQYYIDSGGKCYNGDEHYPAYRKINVGFDNSPSGWICAAFIEN